MAEATNIQMQQFGDQRYRPFAEQWELLIARARSHKLAIDDIYARAVSVNAWNDAREDGPPHLLQSGNSQNPDDFLAFNTLITSLIALADGTPSTEGEKAAAWDGIRDNLATLSRGVVRVIGE